MDPLSVTASVIALLGAGGKIISLLSQVAAIADAPALAIVTLAEMTDISTALRHIQDFVDGAVQVPVERQQHILLEHLVATLTGCLITYSELDAITDSLDIGSSSMSVFDRVKWTLKEASINTLVQRLQNHKSSLNLMLSILQSTSIIEIQQTVTKLHGLVEQLLSGDNDLHRRLSGLEGAATLPSSASNIETILHDSTDDNDDDDNATIRPVIAANRNTVENVEKSTIISFTFDSALANSRVYSRFKYLHSNTHSETSLASSTRRTMAISIFSAISLAEISNISVYSLPISIQEVRNLNWHTGVQAPSLPRTGALQFFINRLRESRSNRLSESNRQSERELKLGPLSRFPATSSDRPPARHGIPVTSIKRQNPDRRPNSSRRQNPDRRLTTAQLRSRVPGTIAETEDTAIHHSLERLATMINQHSLNFYGANAHTISREIGQMIVNEAILGDADGTPPYIPNSI